MLDLLQKDGVLGHEDLGLEDPALLETGALQHPRRSVGQPGRHADAAQHPSAGHDSPNPEAISSLSAATASTSSLPRARTVSELPLSAASIITPMMLFPLTGMPSFTSSISL